MNKGRSTLVLLIAVVVTGVVIALQETWRAKVPSKEFRRVQIFDLNPETLQSLRFESSNLVVECVKENGVWMTGEADGGHGRADVALVYRLLAGLNSLGKGTVITAEHLKMRGIDASEYGFDAPTYRITATDNKGRRSWLIGRKVPLDKMFYAKFADRDDIYTIADSLQEFAPTNPDQLRDRTLFFGEVPGVRRIEIRGDGGFIQLLKDSRSGWQIQQPVAGTADAKVVADFLKRLYKLRIEDFVAENVSDFVVYGLQEESLQVSLGGADGISRMLMVGNKIPEHPDRVYARRGDGTSVFALSTNVVGLLNIKLDELRDVRVLPLPLKSLSSISITRGADHLALERDDSGQWMLTKPVEWKADARAVEKLLSFWGAAVITDFLDSSPLADPEWMLEFGSTELGETNRLGVLPTFGKKDGLHIVRDGQAKPCQINLPLIPESILDPLQYKDRQIWRIKKEDIVKVSVKRDGGAPQSFERSEDGAFISTLPGAPPPDPEAVSRLLNGLASVSTSEYVAYNPPRLATYGLEEPALALHVGLTDTNLLGRVLLVGRETDSGFYSMVKGRDVVFLLQKPLVDLLSSDLAAVPAAGSVSPDSE
jgi:hypothetical protein